MAEFEHLHNEWWIDSISRFINPLLFLPLKENCPNSPIRTSSVSGLHCWQFHWRSQHAKNNSSQKKVHFRSDWERFPVGRTANTCDAYRLQVDLFCIANRSAISYDCKLVWDALVVRSFRLNQPLDFSVHTWMTRATRITSGRR